MTTCAMPMPILSTLARSPSRASAAAVAIQYVLPKAPVQVQLRALDVLAEMPCDWSVATLDQVISDHSMDSRVRQHALRKLVALLQRGIRCGYRALTPNRLAELAANSQDWVFAGSDVACLKGSSAVDDLCDHLSQAVEHGVFGVLPNF